MKKTMVRGMGGIEVKPIPTWVAFKSYISSDLCVAGQSSRGEFLFRGVRDASFELLTSFDRIFSELVDDKRDAVEKLLLDYFKAECEQFPELQAKIQEDKDGTFLLALAQHHGLPTRLLDWTGSPYVAAYFAFQQHLRHDGTRTKDIAIWVLRRSAKNLWSHGSGVKVFSIPTWGNDRMRRQLGWFTHVQMPFRTLEKYVSYVNNPGNALSKITIPASEAARALADLDLMGINHQNLFADLAGAAQSAFVRVVLSDKESWVVPD